jgi:hypothetical protein
VAEKPQPPKKELDEKKANAMERSEMLLNKFENLDKLEKSFEIDEDAKSIESNEIQIIMDDPVIKEVEPAQTHQIDNFPLDSKILIQPQPMNEDLDKPMMDSIVQPKEEVPKEEPIPSSLIHSNFDFDETEK